MCRQALDGYLREQTGVTQETLNWLRDEAIDWTVSNDRLDAGTQEALHHALDNVTVLDPAVGSGAFLIGAMQEIVLLRRGLEQSLVTTDLNPESLEVAEWKRRAITQSLYGVDINPMAVEICKLRLWLSLVIDQQLDENGKPVALPDLDFRIVAGDSLVDRMGADPFIQSLPDPRGAGFTPDMQILQKVNRLQHEIESLKTRFGGEGVQPAEKRDWARRIHKAEIEIARVQLDNALYWARETVAAREKNARTTKKSLKDARDHLAGLERLSAGLQEGAPYQKPFLWPVNFHDVMERGGFDIVLANPPYVRQESLDAIDQESYGHSFQGVHAGTADLLVYFYERAIQLLRDGGQLAFITSNKYMRAGYGGGIREFLPARLQVREVIDFGDLPLFTVAAYPAVLTGRKATPDRDSPVVVADMVYPVRRKLAAQDMAVNHTNVRLALEELPALLHEAAVANYPQALLRKDGWILEDPALVRLFDRLMSQGTPLGEYVQGRMYYGIKTGLNEAFVIDQGKRDELVAADPRSAELIKPRLRGRDVKRWKAQWAGQYLLAVQNSGDSDASNPWGRAASEAEARATFRRSYPVVHDHLSQFEHEFVGANGRVKPGLRARADQGRWWWELRACAYYNEFELPKIVWATVADEGRFALVEGGVYSNQKTYIGPGFSMSDLLVLNSNVFFVLAAATSLAARQHGFYEWERKYMWMLPLPPPDTAAEPRMNELAEAIVNAPSHERTKLESSADVLVAARYGLSEAENALLRAWRARAETPSTDADIPVEDDE